MSFRFTVIMLVDDVGMHIEDAIKSIINQSLDFKENIQLILVNDGSYEGILCQDYKERYPENIIYLSQKHDNYSMAYNSALNHAEGEIVTFMHNNDTLSSTALKEVLKAFDKYGEDIVNIAVDYIGGHRDEIDVPAGIVDLNRNPEYAITFFNSLFIKRNALSEFDERLDLFETSAFFNQILQKKDRYVFAKGARYWFRKRRDTLKINNKDFFNKHFSFTQAQYFTNNLIENPKNDIPIYIQKELLRKFILMINKDSVFNLLKSDETTDFFKLLMNTLEYIDKDVIYESTSNLSMVGFLIAVKNGDISLDEKNPIDVLNARIESDDVILYSKGDVIDELSKRDIYIDFADLKDNILSISGYVKSAFDAENISVYAIKKTRAGQEIIEASSFKYPTRNIKQFLTINWQRAYNFDLTIPVGDVNDISEIELKLKYSDADNTCILQNPIRFRRHSNISYDSHYYIKDSRIVMFDGKFNIMPFSYKNMLRYELKGLLKLYNDKYDFYRRAIFIRTIHLLLYPFMKNRKIWIVMDRTDKADDNGEHFFRYASKQADGIEKYFVIERDSPDFERLKSSHKNIIEFESLKNKILYLFADKVISSQGSEFYLSPFKFEAPYLTAGTAYVDFYFLQHGIILHDLSSWLVRYERHPRLIVTSCRLEYESLKSELYNYDDDVLRLLGLPRYDNLNNAGYKKQIVIMPTWRNYIHNEDDLISSEYFRRFDSLINNERLIEHARQNAYEILFKPHPELEKYMDNFKRNDYVKMGSEKKYQEIFNESAILVTDYSSIFFDFAYLKKPVIYYHYGDDFHFQSDEGYFKYDEMGFGSVTESEDELVDRIISYMDNGAEMEDIFKKRVDDFFEFHDTENSKRCYDAILND